MIYRWNKVTRYTFFALCFTATNFFASQTLDKNLGLQLEANPPMQVIARTPPEPEIPTDNFETREGYRLVSNLDDFRQTLNKMAKRFD